MSDLIIYNYLPWHDTLDLLPVETGYLQLFYTYHSDESKAPTFDLLIPAIANISCLEPEEKATLENVFIYGSPDPERKSWEILVTKVMEKKTEYEDNFPIQIGRIQQIFNQIAAIDTGFSIEEANGIVTELDNLFNLTINVLLRSRIQTDLPVIFQ